MLHLTFLHDDDGKDDNNYYNNDKNKNNNNNGIGIGYFMKGEALFWPVLHV